MSPSSPSPDALRGGSSPKRENPSLGVQDLGSGPPCTSITVPAPIPRLYWRNPRELVQCARGPRAGLAASHPTAHQSTLGPWPLSAVTAAVSPCRRQTCPCCRGNSCTVPASPSRPPPSTWPSTSSSCWTPTPPPPSTPRSSYWTPTSMARGGPLTGGGGARGEAAEGRGPGRPQRDRVRGLASQRLGGALGGQGSVQEGVRVPRMAWLFALGCRWTRASRHLRSPGGRAGPQCGPQCQTLVWLLENAWLSS